MADNKAFAEKFDFNFPLLCDTTKAMGLAYGATDSADGGPANRIGVVVGPDGKVMAVEPQVAPKEWPHQVLATL